MNFLSEHPLQEDRDKRGNGPSDAPVASVAGLTGLVFAASSILSKERRF